MGTILKELQNPFVSILSSSHWFTYFILGFFYCISKNYSLFAFSKHLLMNYYMEYYANIFYLKLIYSTSLITQNVHFYLLSFYILNYSASKLTFKFLIFKLNDFEFLSQKRFQQGLRVLTRQTYLQELAESSNRAQLVEVHQRCGQGP